MTDLTIISGGQTGADQGGLEGSIDAGCKTGGWAPKNFMTELGKNELLELIFDLKDSGLGYKDRTEMNAEKSDVTLWFGNINSAGGIATLNACKKYGKRLIECNQLNPRSVADLIRKNGWVIINIAGNRESHNKGLQLKVRGFIYHMIIDYRKSEGSTHREIS